MLSPPIARLVVVGSTNGRSVVAARQSVRQSVAKVQLEVVRYCSAFCSALLEIREIPAIYWVVLSQYRPLNDLHRFSKVVVSYKIECLAPDIRHRRFITSASSGSDSPKSRKGYFGMLPTSVSVPC